MGDLSWEEKRRQNEGTAKETLQELTGKIIGCAMQVHSKLGPGLLEAAYEECMCHTLARAQLPFRRQVAVPIAFEGVTIDRGFRLDLVVDDRVIVEIKSVEKVLPLHAAQLLTYLKLSGVTTGLLLNFNVVHLRDGISRRSCFSH